MDIGKKLSTVFPWLASTFIALLGLLLIMIAPTGGLLILLSSVFLLPPIAEKLEKLPGSRWLFAVLLISGFVMFRLAVHEDSAKREEARLAQEASERAQKIRQAELKEQTDSEAKRKQFIEHRDVIINELKSLLNTENYQAIVDKGAMYTNFDKEVASLVSQAQEILAERVEAERLAREATERETQIQNILSELDALPDTDKQGHLTRYKKLLQLSPDNKSYQNELDRFQKIAEVERQKHEAEKQQNKALRELQTRWNLSIDKSSLDDSTNVYMHIAANDTIPGTLNLPVRPKLWIRCSENTTSAFVDWDVFINIQNISMIYRIDSQKASTKSFSISTDHEALGYFSGGQSIPFIKSLFGVTKLLIEVTPFGKNPVQVTFDVSGLEQAVVPLRKSCKW
ncbi:MAG: hypothetical protein IPN92_14760 [Chromatiaceae bacterium]|nr:hypothetical protein [Chromatiaceae bacterium]